MKATIQAIYMQGLLTSGGRGQKHCLHQIPPHLDSRGIDQYFTTFAAVGGRADRGGNVRRFLWLALFDPKVRYGTYLAFPQTSLINSDHAPTPSPGFHVIVDIRWSRWSIRQAGDRSAWIEAGERLGQAMIDRPIDRLREDSRS